MDNPETGLTIYSITLGSNPKDGMKWTLKQKITQDNDEYTITLIIADDSCINERRRLIYVSKDGGKTKHLWRSYTNVPEAIVYKL